MQNNNESMATVVETFFIEETLNLIHDNEALAKWNQKVDELGLTGQREVLVEEKSPIPFLWMNDAIIETFQTLCPTKIAIDKYNKTPIPVELLETVSLCVNEKYFDKIEVWYNEKQKDPVIVGYKYDYSQSRSKDEWYLLYYAKKYLVGRWADVKASLDTLTERAKAMFIQTSQNEINKSIKDYQRQLEDLETTAAQKFGNALPKTEMPF